MALDLLVDKDDFFAHVLQLVMFETTLEPRSLAAWLSRECLCKAYVELLYRLFAVVQRLHNAHDYRSAKLLLNLSCLLGRLGRTQASVNIVQAAL